MKTTSQFWSLYCVTTSVAVLAEISLRSPRKLFIFIIKKKIIGSKYPKNKLFNFEKNFTGYNIENEDEQHQGEA